MEETINIGDEVTTSFGKGKIIGFLSKQNYALIEYENFFNGHNGYPNDSTLSKGKFPSGDSKSCRYEQFRDITLIKKKNVLSSLEIW